MVLQCFQFYNVIKTMGKRRKRGLYIFEEKTEEKQNGVIKMISVDGKGTVKVKLEGQSFQ